MTAISMAELVWEPHRERGELAAIKEVVNTVIRSIAFCVLACVPLLGRTGVSVREETN